MEIMPPVDVVKESLKYERDSLVMVSISLLCLVLVMVFTRGDQ